MSYYRRGTDGSEMVFCDLSAESKSETQAGSVGMYLFEKLKDVFLIALVEPQAIIRKAYPGEVDILILAPGAAETVLLDDLSIYPDHYMSLAGVSEMDGIRNKMIKHQTELRSMP